jgi:DNA-binding NtrC family response regulator
MYSEPEVGTTVKVHLPATSDSPAVVPADAEQRQGGSGEVILIVEDEPDVRRMAERILTKNGYSVIGTGDGEEALDVCGRSDQQLDLLLSDVIMPGMLGTELVEKVKEIRPDMSVVFMSGYSHEVLAADALAEQNGSAFIEKPFSGTELLSTIRGLLDSDGVGTG